MDVSQTIVYDITGIRHSVFIIRQTSLGEVSGSFASRFSLSGVAPVRSARTVNITPQLLHLIEQPGLRGVSWRSSGIIGILSALSASLPEAGRTGSISSPGRNPAPGSAFRCMGQSSGS
jgi:hypothetical protein